MRHFSHAFYLLIYFNILNEHFFISYKAMKKFLETLGFF